MSNNPLRFTPLPPPRTGSGQAVRLVVVSGLSGSGKTVALRTLEDLDFYCVDNLPTALTPAFVESVTASQPGRYPRLAVGVDARNRPEDLNRLPEILAGLARTGIDFHVVFLDTRDEILFKRFSDTRRRHPLTSESISLADAIALERRLLRPLAAIADRVIDTSDLNVHQLRGWIVELFAADSPDAGMQVSVVSFGYKHGLPIDVDLVFDCRFLPNPHWVDELRPLTGRDQEVKEYVLGRPETKEFLAELDKLFALLLPGFIREGKSYLRVALGCTGGRHRSVVIAEELARILKEHDLDPAVVHRDVDR